MNVLHILDLSEIKPEVLAGLENGSARVVNGVARSISGGQLLQHLPFRPVNVDEAGALLPVGQKVSAGLGVASNAALAVSTVAVMGTVIVCTAYLARKLDRIQQKVDVIERELQGQNLLFYVNKINGYYGALESLRELMIDAALAKENADLVIEKLNVVGMLRCELYSFSDNLPQLTSQFTPHHRGLALDFVLESLDLLPKGVYLEAAAAYRIDRIRLGDTIRSASLLKHEATLENLRGWANKTIRAVAEGSSGGISLANHMNAIRALLVSDENRLLLTTTA